MVRKQNHQLDQGANIIIQDQATAKDESSLGTQDVESDDSMKWEDFFGSSVDITSALLDMYDLTVTKDPKESDCRAKPDEIRSTLFSSACNGDKKRPIMGDRPVLNSRPSHLPMKSGVPKLHLTLAPLQAKDCDRPLSTSSLSSSTSSSSSSSLPRRDSKKLYLASIESLDDEFSEDCAGGMSSSRDPSPPDRARTKLEAATVYESAQVHCGHSIGSGSFTASGSGSRDFSLSHTDRVILEIIETERTYVQDLQEIIEGYLLYIPENVNSRVDSKSLTDLFSNIEDIYKFNRTFLCDLEVCGLDSVAVARCFFKHSYGFAIYTQYCTNYPRTVSVLTELMRNSQTAEIFKERQIALHHNLPLGSYLLKPVQRILRYRLLLENIVKASDKDSEGYADIKNALSVMTGIAYHINDMKKRHENAIRVQEIQSLLYGWVGQDLTTYGELVAEGAFRMYRTKTLRHLFLFDKMLLIAKKKEEGILCYKTHIMCSNLMLIESIQGEPLCFHVIPFDNPREQHTFQARNTEQKREWCLQLKRVILENYNAVIPSHARQLVMELGQSKQEDSVHLEKSSSKRQLSAPEYLEKRKQERRKSESSIKPFKIKKGLKKNDTGSPKASPSSERYNRQLRSVSYDQTQTKKEGKPQSRWRRASVDVIPRQSDVGNGCKTNIEAKKKSKSNTLGDTSASDSEKRSEQLSFFHSKGFQSQRERSSFIKKQHNSLPEETTDTENEEHSDKMDISFLDFRPPPRTLNLSEEVDSRLDDVGGEYVTFYFANSHVNRNRQRELVTPVITVDDSYDDGYCTLSPQMFLPEPNTSLPVSPSTSRMKSSSDSSTCSSKSNTISKHEMKISANYDNLLDLWSKLGTVQVNGCENNDTDQSSTSSPVIRRVHSFTGTEKEKHSLYVFKSFRESSSRTYLKSRSQITSGSEEVVNSANSLMLPQDETKASPVSPSVWLTQQQEHLNQPTQKSVSLPWSFHIGNQTRASDMDENIHESYESKGISQTKLTGKGWSFIPETRAQTLPGSQPPQVDVVNDLEKYISSSQDTKNILRFPVEEDEFKGYDTTSSRGSTLYASTNSVNSFHPDHKIYQHGGSKSLSLKNMLSSVSSRLTSMKTSMSSPSMEDMENINDLKTGTCLDGSNHSINESKIISTKFAHSLGKAYSAILKQKHKGGNKDLKISSPQISRHGVTFHKPGSSVIGARVAYPLDSEYCMLDNFIPLRRDKYGKEETSRPDSLLSASSNMTSSSDSDKASISTDIMNLSNHNIPDCLINKFAETLYEKSSQSSVHSQSTHSSLLSLVSLPKSPHDVSEKQSLQATNSSVLCITEPNLKVDASLQKTLVNIDSNSAHIAGESSSDSSDVSGDSYYERTFEAIENALVEEIFRDSAIYSDPDELDLSALTCGLSISSDTKDINEVLEVPVVKAVEPHENGSFFPNEFVPTTDIVEEHPNETISRSMNPQENFELLFVRRVNRNIIDRLQCLEENHNCEKDVALGPSSLEGLKSIRQRWKELEKWHSSTAAEKNTDSNKEAQSVNCFQNCEQSSGLVVDNENSQPKGKGWVKHVVNKLQNETS